MDVSSAFLNGDLEEEIFMEQPEGFVSKGNETLVCWLNKLLYGLKQSPQQWYQKIDATFKELGFRNCFSYESVYVWARDGTVLSLQNAGSWGSERHPWD